jgi:hypothetical protein
MPITDEEFQSAKVGDHFYGFPDEPFEVIETKADSPCPVLKLLSPRRGEVEVYYDSPKASITKLDGAELPELSHPDAWFEPQSSDDPTTLKDHNQPTEKIATGGWLTDDFIF